MKYIRILLLTLALSLLLPAAMAEEAPGYNFGDVVADFTVTTTDGEALTLSDLLAENKAVLLNFFFADCGPCRMEFPFMEKAWQEYRDDVALVALSPYDSAERIASYKADLGLNFYMGVDDIGLTNLFVSGSFPTTVMIDRNGVFCYYQVGSMPSEYPFRALFEAFTADDYAEPLVGYVIPDPKPSQPMPASDELAAALGSKGILFSGEENAWPWLITEEAVVTSNKGLQNTRAVLHMDFTAKAGDVLAFEYRVSGAAGVDTLAFVHGGKQQKLFTGETGWRTFAWEIPADGAQLASFVYTKGSTSAPGEDAAMLRSVKLLSGEEATAALAANPAYPMPLEAGKLDISLANATAKEILVDDPYGLMNQIIGVPTRYYILPDATAQVQVRIGPGIDPDAAFLYDSLEQRITMLAQAEIAGDSFVGQGKVYSMQDGGNPFSVFMLYPDFHATSNITAVLVFADEVNANYFLKTYIEQATGGAIPGLEWTYAAPAEATYTIVFADETSARLPGVIANVCDEELCIPMFSDANGVVTFTMAPKAYDIHVISAPEGIAFDPNQGYKTSETGGEMTITLPRK